MSLPPNSEAIFADNCLVCLNEKSQVINHPCKCNAICQDCFITMCQSPDIMIYCPSCYMPIMSAIGSIDLAF